MVNALKRSTRGTREFAASDFGAALGPLSAPWLFLNVPQDWLFGALAAVMASGVGWCLARR